MMEFLGGEGGGNSSLTKWAIIGGAAIGLFLLIRGKRPDGAPAPAYVAPAPEFGQQLYAAGPDIVEVTGAQTVFANSQAGLSRTFSASDWSSLPKATRRAYARQAKGGRLLVLPGPNNTVTTVPTGRGLRGDEPRKRAKPRPWYEAAADLGTSYYNYKESV